MTSSVVGPSGPRPGVERLAEVLRAHEPIHHGMSLMCGCGMTLALAETHPYADQMNAAYTAHQAVELAAAIPSLPVEALAELVGGEVGYGVKHNQGIRTEADRRMAEESLPGMTKRYEDSSRNKVKPEIVARVVTPWRSVTSPEENR